MTTTDSLGCLENANASGSAPESLVADAPIAYGSALGYVAAYLVAMILLNLLISYVVQVGYGVAPWV